MGPRIYQLGVSPNSSVFVQFFAFELDRNRLDFTLETVVKTITPICVISEKPPCPI
jgi:hypothetical protein